MEGPGPGQYDVGKALEVSFGSFGDLENSKINACIYNCNLYPLIESNGYRSLPGLKRCLSFI